MSNLNTVTQIAVATELAWALATLHLLWAHHLIQFSQRKEVSVTPPNISRPQPEELPEQQAYEAQEDLEPLQPHQIEIFDTRFDDPDEDDYVNDWAA